MNETVRHKKIKCKSDDTPHEETNYTKVQYMLLRLCLKDFYENSHDCGDSMIAIS